MVYRMCFDEEAYLAGYIAADGHINKKDYTISIYTGKYESALILFGYFEKFGFTFILQMYTYDS